MTKKKTDNAGYLAADANANPTDSVFPTDDSSSVADSSVPSADALNAPTANQGYNTAQSQGWAGTFKDFLNHFNTKNDQTGTTPAENIGSFVKGLFGGGTSKPASVAPPKASVPTKILGMSTGVFAVVSILVVVGLGFGIYELTKKKS